MTRSRKLSIKRQVIIFLLGIIAGWLTVPLVFSEIDTEFHGYMGGLKVIVNLMTEMDTRLKQIEENTRRFK